jgi:hypothetical protein
VRPFRGMFEGRLSPLVTCIIQRTDDSWGISWVGDGRVPGEFFEETLTRATVRASAEVAAMYAGRVEASDAELQFAIYPWGGDGGRIILDITSDAEGYVARAIQGSDVSVWADNLEGVVERAEQSLGDTGNVMLRWIRRVSTIPAS